MSNEQFKQSESSIAKNANFFDTNDNYIQQQSDLEIYNLIRLTVEREMRDVKHLLDIGNGGFFNYSIDHIPEVIACDVAVQDSQPKPNVTFKNASILELPFENHRFDCVLIQNVLHHITGKSVSYNEHNMLRALQECSRVLKPGGKFVIVESTVPQWFYYGVEYPLYTLLQPIWPFPHPLTFQFMRRQIANTLTNCGLNVEEQLIVPRGRWVLQFGLRFPTAFTPIDAVKFVAVKQPS